MKARTGRGTAGHGRARQGEAWLGLAWLGKARQGEAWHGFTYRTNAILDPIPMGSLDELKPLVHKLNELGLVIAHATSVNNMAVQRQIDSFFGQESMKVAFSTVAKRDETLGVVSALIAKS